MIGIDKFADCTDSVCSVRTVDRRDFVGDPACSMALAILCGKWYAWDL